MKRFLLCTDLDRTLIPNGEQPESPAAMERFRRLVNCSEVTLAYVTGRHRPLIEQAIAEFGLPQPDFAIADVGSTIYRINAAGWQHWSEWEVQITPDWCGLTYDDVYRLLRNVPGLELQENEKQGRHKLSFYVRPEVDVPGLIEEMRGLLQHAGIKSNFIWSRDEAADTGLLDILPVSANKLHAIEFLRQQQGFGCENTVFAGDSGNDLDVLLSGMRAILVANADPDTRRLAASRTDASGLYVARGGYLGMNGNYSAGILEGVAYHLPDVDVWLRQSG